MISLLVVNYRSAALAAEAIRSARAATMRPLEIVVVDNSCDAAEVSALRLHADTVLAPEKNLGYAGGINHGRTQCHGEILLVSNPDVIYGERSVDALAEALEMRDAAVAGPALFWDAAHRWMLPPADLHTLPRKVDEAIASRSSTWRAWRDRRQFRRRLAFWSASGTREVDALSGAVMAIRAADFDAVNGFDASFELYFEENDFLRRVSQRGGRVLYVPSSRCRHLYNQSAGIEGSRAAELYAQSEMRYLAKWSSASAARAIGRVTRSRREPDAPRIDGAMPIDGEGVVVEASPLADFATAAGYFPEPGSVEVDIPQEVWSAYRSEVLYLRAVDRSTGRPRATVSRYRS